MKSHVVWIAALTAALLVGCSGAGNLTINEVGANGSDFVELYNGGDRPVTLKAGEWSIKSGEKMDKAFVFPEKDLKVSAKAFVLIIAPPDIEDDGSVEDWELPTLGNNISNVSADALVITTPGENKQTGEDPADCMSVDDSGDTLTLMHGSKVIAVLETPEIPEGDPEGVYTYGSFPDGSDTHSNQLTATPGSANKR
ncbi:lamin tail domain-containing protein [Sediminispirochaeta bajacaliforniensis]|uniref:lamin tail domain-containing protein n=1 Tax=Sediminispirochaeta bajacaliforniensis TaxID=148 RepID=UPI00036E424A|nr:lamin tail domain-containing protein [Sediminispirochaeta bajacaliforniensis]